MDAKYILLQLGVRPKRQIGYRLGLKVGVEGICDLVDWHHRYGTRKV
jgi:hypothetical protein